MLAGVPNYKGKITKTRMENVINIKYHFENNGISDLYSMFWECLQRHFNSYVVKSKEQLGILE